MRVEKAGNRDPDVIRAAHAAARNAKHLPGVARMNWKKPTSTSPQYKWRAVAEEIPVSDADLVVTGFFSPTKVPGRQDKHAFTLLFAEGHRVVCVEGGTQGHRNRVGHSMPGFVPRVGEFHAHLVCGDAVDGYAVNLPAGNGEDLWNTFVVRSNLRSAPRYEPPVAEIQRRFDFNAPP